MTQNSSQKDNFYQILKVSADADQDAIRRAYLVSSLQTHPDKIADPNRKDEFKRKFQTLTEIYRTLSDPVARLEYDKKISIAFEQRDVSGHDEISLVECVKDDSCYSYACRCSGSFTLPCDHLAQLADTTTFIVNCDSCSSLVKIRVK